MEYTEELFKDERGELPQITNMEGPPIIESEIINALNKMKTSKVVGNDGMSTEKG